MASISLHTNSTISAVRCDSGFNGCISLDIKHKLAGGFVYSADCIILHGTIESNRRFAQAILDATDGKGFRIEQVDDSLAQGGRLDAAAGKDGAA